MTGGGNRGTWRSGARLTSLLARQVPRSSRHAAAWIFLAVSGYSVVASSVLAWYLRLPEKQLATLGNGFGDLVHSLMTTGRYQVCASFCQGAHRFPLVPLFLYAVSFLTQNVVLVLIVKNLVFSLALAHALHTWYRGGPSWLDAALVGWVLLTPQFLLHGFNLSAEEGYVTPLVACLAAILCGPPRRTDGITTGAVIFGVVNAVLFCAKSSVVYLCAVMPFLYFGRFRSRKAMGLHLGLVACAALAVAGFNLHNSGRFTVGSSMDGFNLSKGNNEHTLEHYPRYGLDAFDSLLAPAVAMTDEWQFDAYYASRAATYMRGHVAATLRGMAIKAAAIFLEVRPYGTEPGEVRYDGWTKYVGSIFMVGNRLVFLIVLGWGARAMITGSRSSGIAWCFVVLVAAYALPFVAGFAYERHAVPLLLPAVFVLRRLPRHNPHHCSIQRGSLG